MSADWWRLVNFLNLLAMFLLIYVKMLLLFDAFDLCLSCCPLKSSGPFQQRCSQAGKPAVFTSAGVYLFQMGSLLHLFSDFQGCPMMRCQTAEFSLCIILNNNNINNNNKFPLTRKFCRIRNEIKLLFYLQMTVFLTESVTGNKSSTKASSLYWWSEQYCTFWNFLIAVVLIHNYSTASKLVQYAWFSICSYHSVLHLMAWSTSL